DVPTNGGVTRVVRVSAPAGCLVHARFPSAVAAGNVETSQRIADTVFLALANGGLPVPAQGQGTMNNVTFGGQLAAGNVQRGGGGGAAASYENSRRSPPGRKAGAGNGGATPRGARGGAAPGPLGGRS